MRRVAAGFSLLEALVTLVIVALIVTVLMQALQHALDLRVRLLRYQSETRVATLQEQWFRESVSATIADLHDGLGAFDGGPEGLSFISLQPLGGRGVDQVRWWLEPVPGGWSLHYADAEWEDITVIPGPLAEARFAYLDPAGEWRDAWRPTPEDEVVLPRGVRLAATTRAGELEWWVPILAAPGKPQNLRPLEAGVYGL